jgi:TRAP-type C4-dicarboxylate transport system substrate-binding protein
VFAIPNGATNIETVYAEKWMDLVGERSEGKITFDYTNAGALGSYADASQLFCDAPFAKP